MLHLQMSCGPACFQAPRVLVRTPTRIPSVATRSASGGAHSAIAMSSPAWGGPLFLGVPVALRLDVVHLNVAVGHH